MPLVHNKIFDPGKVPSLVNYHGDEDLELDLHLWAISNNSQLHKPISIRSGYFEINGIGVHLSNILFDTGALHRSYINQSLINQHRQDWSSNIHAHSSKIRLGDQKTIINSNEEIHGSLSFTNPTATADISCIVHDMPGLDLIIGLITNIRSR